MLLAYIVEKLSGQNIGQRFAFYYWGDWVKWAWSQLICIDQVFGQRYVL
jgi:hypothetical protein